MTALRRSRARRDQHFRRDVLRPPKCDPTVRLKKRVNQCYLSAVKKERYKHYADALNTTEKALGHLQEFPDQDEYRLTMEKKLRELAQDLTRKIRYRQKQHMRDAYVLVSV